MDEKRRRIRLSLFLCMLVFVLPGRAYAESLEISSGGQDSCVQTEERGTISVTAEAKDYVTPDTSVVTLAVETTGKAASEAVEENGRRAEQVVKALRLLMGSEKGTSIKTSSFSVEPIYEYDNINKRNLLTGYRARHQVTVTIRKVEMAGTIIDSGIQNGANEVDGVTFALSELKEYCEGVLKKAADEAQHEAAFVAQTLGARISGVKSISPSCGTETPRPIYRQALMAAQAVPARETSIESGDIAVNASISIVFYMEKKE
ncbi:MAG: SIMPL domain-containing protein [Thermodesulfovibrionales bacterium]|jgi:uncharacterized protein YggE